MSLKNPFNSDTAISVEYGTSLIVKRRFGYFIKCLFFEVIPTAFSTQKYHSVGVWSFIFSESIEKPNPNDLSPFAHLSQKSWIAMTTKSIRSPSLILLCRFYSEVCVTHFFNKISDFQPIFDYSKISTNASRLFKYFSNIISSLVLFFFTLHTLKEFVYAYWKNVWYVFLYKKISSY